MKLQIFNLTFAGRFGIAALLLAIAVSGLFGSDSSPRSAEAAFLPEVMKLIASDAEAADGFGISVAVSGDTTVVGAFQEELWRRMRAPSTCSSGTRWVRIGAR